MRSDANSSGVVKRFKSSRSAVSWAACRRMKIILAVRAKLSESKAAGTNAALTALTAVGLTTVPASPASLPGTDTAATGSFKATRCIAAGCSGKSTRGVGCHADDGAALPAPAPAPAPENAPASAGPRAKPPPPKRRIRKRIRKNAATASRAIMRKLPKAAPMPRWLISAAMPRPAAKPAMGPIQLRLAAAAGAAPAVAAAALAGAACWPWAGVAGLAGTASGAVRAGMLRCMPEDLAPPRRLASASKGMLVATTATARAPINQFFMGRCSSSDLLGK